MLTTGEVINATLRFYVNAGSQSVAYDQELRERALFFLKQLTARAKVRAPLWFLYGDGSVTLTGGAGNGYGSLPSDFAAFGTEGQVYVSGQTSGPLEYTAPDALFALRQQDTSLTSNPTRYTLHGKTVLGLSQIYVYPVTTGVVTLTLKNYEKRSPDLVDRPYAPTVAAGSAGSLTGAYTWRITYVTADGETEGGDISASLTVTSKRVSLTGISTSPSRNVTSRKVYRTAASGDQHKLVATIADNVTTTYTDNTTDGSLGANVPTPASAVTGMEQWPEDFHEALFAEGLIARFMRSQGDGRDQMNEFDADVRRMWANQKQGQNALRLMPRYGETSGLPMRSARSRFPSL